MFPVHLRLTPMVAPVRTRYCCPLHHDADCLSEIQSFHVSTQADGPQLQMFRSIKGTLKDPFPGASSASTFSISPVLLPLTPLPCAHYLMAHPCSPILFQCYFSVVGSNRWYSIALSFAFGAWAEVHHKGSTPTKLNAFIRLRAVAHN